LSFCYGGGQCGLVKFLSVEVIEGGMAGDMYFSMVDVTNCSWA
jgi:hypothetical protein